MLGWAVEQADALRTGGAIHRAVARQRRNRADPNAWHDRYSRRGGIGSKRGQGLLRSRVDSPRRRQGYDPTAQEARRLGELRQPLGVE